MAFQEEQRATPHSNQTVNLEEGSAAKKLEELEKKRKRQANGDISEGPSTKKARLVKQSSSLIEVTDQEISDIQQIGETQGCEELPTKKKETISRSSKVKSPSKKATPRKRKALDDVSNRKRARKQHKKEPLKKGRVRSELRKKTEREYKKLLKCLRNVTMEEIEWLCHCTTPKAKQQIEQDGQLLGNNSTHPKGAPLASTDQVKGVWFIATLYKGDLATRSPYGGERAKLHLCKLINSKNKDNWKVFFESAYHYSGRVQYVRLVLANEETALTHNKEGYEWCKENLYQLDNSNCVLCCSDDDELLRVIKNDGVRPNIYIEVLLLGNTPNDFVEWDTVEDMDTRTDKEPTCGILETLENPNNSKLKQLTLPEIWNM